MAVPGGTGPGYTGGYAPRSRVRFEVIGEAWRLLQQQMGTWVLTALVYLVCVLGINFGMHFIVGAVFGTAAQTVRTGAGLGTLLGAMLGANLITTAVVSIIGFFFHCGLMRMATKQLRGEMISVGDLFSVTDVLGPVIVGGILYNVITFIGTLACILPGIVLAALLMFTPALIADQRLGGVEAISESFNALKNDALMAILFVIVMVIIGLISAIPCLLGLLVIVPLYALAVALLYRDFFSGAPTAYPDVTMPPPPGSAPPPMPPAQ